MPAHRQTDRQTDTMKLTKALFAAMASRLKRVNIRHLLCIKTGERLC